MDIKQIAENFFITAQLQPDAMGMVAARGFASVFCARPDNEEAGQPSFATVQAAAAAAGLQCHSVPISNLTPGAPDVQAFAAALETLPGPVLGYCRTGGRAAALYNAVNPPAA